jgi:hypothetical protein
MWRMLKHKEKSPFENPQDAAQELVRIARPQVRADWAYAYIGKTNFNFLNVSGGSLLEYVAGRDFAIANKWFELDGGGRMTFLPDCP